MEKNILWKKDKIDFDSFKGEKIEYLEFETLDSTNTYAKENAKNFNNKFTVVRAKKQEKGRGRLQRSFISHSDKGAYFSLVIKPDENELPLEYIGLMAIMTSCALAVGLEDLTGLRVGIKWPNDILVNKKKLCGILSESRIGQKQISLLILGVGINVNNEQMHPDIKDIATSVYLETKTQVDIDNLIKYVCRNIIVLYDKITKRKVDDILKIWNSYSLMTNREITYEKDGKVFFAISKGIDSKGQLVVESERGIESLNCNEVRLTIEGEQNGT